MTHHAGVIMLPQEGTTASAQVRALTLYVALVEPEDIVGQLDYLTNWMD